MDKAKVIPVKRLMQTKFFTIYPDQSTFEAIEIIESEDNVEAICVIKKEYRELVGIVTPWDIVTRCNALSKKARRTHIYECMTSNPIKVVPSMSCYETMILMASFKVSHLPVVERGKLVGIIHARDIAKITMLTDKKNSK